MDLLSQWDTARNAPLTPDDVTFGSHKKVWWTCPSGHSWQAMVCTRSAGAGCPYCTDRKASPEQNSLAKQFPALAVEWDDEKNAPLTPRDVTPGSHKLIWWRCPKGHSYRSAVKTRAQGSGCPYCAGKNVLPEETSLAAEYPSLAKEWDAAKNVPLLPTQVISGTRRKVWWRCPKGHSYRSAVKTRVQGSGCPYCAGKSVLPEENSLAAEYPVIAKDWDAAKNKPLTPNQVISGTKRKVWWLCPKGHSWCAAVFSRTVLGTGFPVCTGRQALAGENDLATLYPDVAVQWDGMKNGALRPNNVTAGSNRRVWWKCEKGHSYRAVIAQRVQRGDGCPVCAGKTKRTK